MKYILKQKKYISLKLKLFILSVFSTGAIAFIGNLYYTNKDKKVLPYLTPSIQLRIPECSANGGFYTEEFAVKLNSTQPNSRIFYSLDGSEPSLASSLYNHPFVIRLNNAQNNLSNIPTSPRWKPPIGSVFKGIVLRAISVTYDNKKSQELVRTFFIDPKGSKKYSIAVIALTVNPDDFFGYRRGIYILGKNYDDKDNYVRKNISLDQPWWSYPSNYSKRGSDSERPAHLEFFCPDGTLGFECNAGVRINGNRTRGLSQKSLRITFDEHYGVKELIYKLFPNYRVNKFNSFILRNSGNDWNKTMFRDAFMQFLMIETKLDIQQYRPSIVFINGEYWGIHNIRERLDENYLANKYYLNKDSIAILESGNVFYGEKQDSMDFQQLLSFVKKNDMSNTNNYLHVKKLIDIENFMDFIIANIYFCNGDWQEKFWRFKTRSIVNDSLSVNDGRWRWVLYDTDWGFGYTGSDAVKLNLFDVAVNGKTIGLIFNRLLKNRIFLEEFNQRFQFHLNNTFNKERVIKIINEFENTLKPEMIEHINRWRGIDSYDIWESNVQELKKFAIERPSIQVKQLNDFIKKIKQQKSDPIL